MKFLSFILAFTILTLTLVPGINSFAYAANLSATETSCCGDSCVPVKDNDAEHNDDENNGCTDENCNPFDTCCFHGMICQHFKISLELIKPHFGIVKNIETASHIHSIYLSESWQPPELV